MSKKTEIRRGRASSVFGLPYGGQQIPRDSDIYAEFAAKLYPFQQEAIQMIGIDLASGPDMSAITLRYGKLLIPLMTDGKLTLDPQFLDGLNANRSSERELLANVFCAIAEARGATIERRYDAANPGFHGPSIALRFGLNGVGAMFDVDDLHGGRYAVISWHNHYERRDHSKAAPIPREVRGPRDFTGRFNVAVGATPSTRAHHKATSCCGSWSAVAIALDAGLQLAIRGEAFTA